MVAPSSKFYDSIWVGFCLKTEAVAQRCSLKKVFLEIFQNSQENTCLFFNKVANSGLQLNIKKQTLPLVFSCEFCGICKNTSAASVTTGKQFFLEVSV